MQVLPLLVVALITAVLLIRRHGSSGQASPPPPNAARRDLVEAYQAGISEGERRTQAALKLHTEAAYREGYAAGSLQVNPVRKLQPTTRRAALELLELPANATGGEVRGKVRKLRGALHPDALRSKGYPASFIEYGAELFKAVGVASEVLEKELS